MARYINPFSDWSFKRIFGQEYSKDLLIEFLNQLLLGEQHITDVKFKDKEMLPETKDQRGIIYDVFCETDTGEHIIVEMQKQEPVLFHRPVSLLCIENDSRPRNKRTMGLSSHTCLCYLFHEL